MSNQALILFAHGARDPTWAAPFERLQEITRTRLPMAQVELAFLELMQPTLPQVLEQLAADGVVEVSIVPVFLGQGGHIKRDLPLLVAQAQQRHPGVTIKMAQAVGEQTDVLNAIAEYCIATLLA